MDTILAFIGTGVAGLWLLLFFIGYPRKKYTTYINQLDKSLFRLAEIYFIGFALLDILHIRCNKGFFAKKLKQLAELFGEKYAVFYNYALWAGKITMCLTLVPVMVFVGMLSGESILGWLGLVVGPVIAMSMDTTVAAKIEERREIILMDFPQIMSKLVMLLKAGMTLQDAWRQVAFSGEKIIYKEMQITHLEIQKGGAGTEQAYLDFAQRCNVPEIRKFASLVIQNMKKGGSDMIFALQEMADERWQQKKHMVLRKGELAGNKLLMPIMLMFVGVMILIMVPAFTSMSF